MSDASHAILPERLARLRFFDEMSAPVLSSIAAIASERRFAAGSLIFREGDIHPDLFVLESGHASLEMNIPRRRRAPILTLGPGDLLGWSAARGERPMTATAVAIDDVVAMAIPAARLLELCETDHEVGYRFHRQLSLALSRRLLATRLQMLDLFAETTSH